MDALADWVLWAENGRVGACPVPKLSAERGDSVTGPPPEVPPDDESE
jgi:hypothetical protein